jgi:hypothetical protein
LPHRRFLKTLLSYLAVCTCLAAAPASPGSEEATSNASYNWLETLRDLPVVHWFVPPESDMTRVTLSPPPAACGVVPLPAIADADALAFEKRTSPETSSLMPAMARALEKFQQLVNSVGGTFELRSAYRPASYQAHLQAVWFKWILELHNNRAPGCQTLREQVSEEFARHNLLETQKPVASSDHTRDLAFDATVVLPRITQAKKRGASLDRLALLAGIKRPDILRDPVHFKLVIGRGRRRA